MKAIVVGAGIGGLTAARALVHAGADVTVLEQASGLRTDGTALSIMSNAIAALRLIGIRGKLEAAGAVIECFRIHTLDGRLISEAPIARIGSDLGAPSVCIHRPALLSVLHELCESDVRFGCPVREVRSAGGMAEVVLSSGETLTADLVVGADGFHSVARPFVAGDVPIRKTGYVCYLATPKFGHKKLTRGFVGHYWGRGVRFGLIDIGHGRAYWWATRNAKDVDRALGASKMDIESLFAEAPDEVRAAIAATSEQDVVRLEARDRAPTSPWTKSRVVLLGDAAHAMLTSLGQGAGMAIEDAVVLGRAVASSRSVEEALERYVRGRRRRAEHVAALSRTISGIEQLDSGLATSVRDAVLRAMPPWVVEAQHRSILAFKPPFAS